jgi:hypothetical protein
MADQSVDASTASKGEEGRFSWSRFSKYTVLLLAVALLLMITFDSFSFYVARRDLDTELKSRRIPSLEYITVLSQRERALALTSLEGRCLERAQLTMFRILEAEHEPIQRVYRQLIEKKNAITDAVNESKGLIDSKSAADFIEGPTFELSKLEGKLAPLNDKVKDSEQYKKFKEDIEKKVEEYMSVARHNAPLRHVAEKIIEAHTPDDLKYWDMNKVAELETSYRELVEKKNAIINTIKQFTSELNDRDKAVEFIASTEFDVRKLDAYLEPPKEQDRASAEYQTFRKNVAVQVKSYASVAQKNAQLRRELEKMIEDIGLKSKYWDTQKILELVNRIDQVREERKKNKEKMGDVEDLVARYNIWTGALTGGVGQGAVLDDVAYQFGKADTERLKNVNCQRFSEYYEAVTGKVAAADPTLGKSWPELTWPQALGTIPRSYRQFLLLYFQQAPQAQTLFVTLFLGALGALTLNILRLSHVGWWRDKQDPLWGDIIVGPFLGALAAFGIFLVGSAGLLLATEGSNSQPPSAYFIGLLGFLSGLSYDEAFGRVRLIGEQMFKAVHQDEEVNARAEDRSLAGTLKGMNASRVASLILKHGTRLTADNEFTLLVPSDQAIGQIPLTIWTKLESDSIEFDKWYARHHSAKRITKGDLPANGSINVEADDGVYEMKIEQGGLTIGGSPVVIADVIWNKGVIHILGSELPDRPATRAQ